MRNPRAELRTALEPVFTRRAGRPSLLESSPLADEVAALLSLQTPGLPLAEIARQLHRRQADLRAALRSDARFAPIGSTRGRRWRLVTYR